METKLHLRGVGSDSTAGSYRAGTKLDWSRTSTKLDGSGTGAGGYRPWGGNYWSWGTWSRTRTSIGRSGSSLNSSWLFRYTCRSWRGTKELGRANLGLEVVVKHGEGNRSGLWCRLLWSR